MNLKEKLTDMRACQEAVNWVGDRDLETAWAECKRPDWMLWFASRIIDRPLLVKVTGRIARRALQYVPAGEDRPRIATETAEAWADGKATIEEVKTAADAAYAAADAAECKVQCQIIREMVPVELLLSRIEGE